MFAVRRCWENSWRGASGASGDCGACGGASERTATHGGAATEDFVACGGAAI